MKITFANLLSSFLVRKKQFRKNSFSFVANVDNFIFHSKNNETFCWKCNQNSFLFFLNIQKLFSVASNQNSLCQQVFCSVKLFLHSHCVWISTFVPKCQIFHICVIFSACANGSICERIRLSSLRSLTSSPRYGTLHYRPVVLGLLSIDFAPPIEKRNRYLMARKQKPKSKATNRSAQVLATAEDSAKTTTVVTPQKGTTKVSTTDASAPISSFIDDLLPPEPGMKDLSTVRVLLVGLAILSIGTIAFFHIPGMISKDIEDGGNHLVNSFYCATMTLTTWVVFPGWLSFSDDTFATPPKKESHVPHDFSCAALVSGIFVRVTLMPTERFSWYYIHLRAWDSFVDQLCN